MVDGPGETAGGGARGRPFPKARSGGIRAFQPEDEHLLQISCRCSGLLFLGQPQVAGFRLSHGSNPWAAGPREEAPRTANHLNAPEHERGLISAKGAHDRGATPEQKPDVDAPLLWQR